MDIDNHFKKGYAKMKSNNKFSNMLITVAILLCGLLCLSSCTNSKDNTNVITFTNESGIELNIGMTKSYVEQLFNSSYENGTFYPVEGQHCCVGFINDKLVYVEYGTTWKMSEGPQLNDKMADLISFYGNPSYEESFVEPSENVTKYIRMDFVFSNIKYVYSGYTDYEHITGVTCMDNTVDVSIIEKNKAAYDRAIFDEWLAVQPIEAINRYDDNHIIILAIGADKKVYEEIFGRSFDNKIYYELEPYCSLYFENDILALYGFGKGWGIYKGDASFNMFGKSMPELLEKLGSPIFEKMNMVGNYYEELTFELENGQNVTYCATEGTNKINYILVADGNIF